MRAAALFETWRQRREGWQTGRLTVQTYAKLPAQPDTHCVSGLCIASYIVICRAAASFRRSPFFTGIAKCTEPSSPGHDGWVLGIDAVAARVFALCDGLQLHRTESTAV